MEQDQKRQFVIFTYIYKHPFENVKRIFKNCSLAFEINNRVVKDFTTDFRQLKLSTTWEEGSEFSVIFKKVVTLIFKTIEHSETDNNFKIKWLIKTEPPTPEYYLTYNLYADFTGNFTTFVMEWNYLKHFSFNLNQETKEVLEERTKIYKNYDDFLTNEDKEKTHKQLIFIKSELKTIWSFIKNLKQMREKIPLLGDSVEYVCDLKKGSEVIFKWNTKEQTSQAFAVVKSITETDSYCELVLFCNKGIPAVPRQYIKWRIEKCEEELCQVSFEHIYKDFVKESSLSINSKIKTKILESLKSTIELDNMLKDLNS
jgi:hypothetical protein